MTDDAEELVEWLCTRFNKDKLFIIGGSWGSELGTHLAYNYPTRIAAYVGLGQVANGPENETISYQFALDNARKAGDEKALKQLAEIGPPENGVYKGGLEALLVQRKIMIKHGGYSPDTKKRSVFQAFVIPILLSGEYSPGDIIGIIRGYKKVLRAMWDEVAAVDLAGACPRFEMPYFIFDGRLDFNTPAILVEEYFSRIESPRKELVWFEESGHNPMGDEPEHFKMLLRSRLTEVAEAERGKGVVI